MNEPSAGTSCDVSPWWPTRTPAYTHSTEMNRANTWASVTNSSVAALSLTISGISSVVFLASSTKLPCVSTHPLGFPVVPAV